MVRLTHDQPALRAVWLMVYESAEQTFAKLIGRLRGLPTNCLAVGARAAGFTAALQLATDDLARAVAGAGRPDPVHANPGALAAILQAVSGCADA